MYSSSTPAIYRCGTNLMYLIVLLLLLLYGSFQLSSIIRSECVTTARLYHITANVPSCGPATLSTNYTMGRCIAHIILKRP